MAYGTTGITSCIAYTTASEFADDGTQDVDNTTCMTNGTTGESCDEIKDIIVLKVTLNLDPASISALSIRFYHNDNMGSSGSGYVTPYIDSNSVSSTNVNTQTYNSTGVWVEHASLSAAFIAQLADLGGGTCAVRFSSDGTTKPKIGEVNIDYTLVTYTLAGVTRDVDGTALGSVEYQILKRTALGSETWSVAASGTSNSSTGAYSEAVAKGTYRVVAVKDIAPQIQDITPPLTLATATASDDVFSLGTYSGLANNDKVYAYQAGASALPGGISEDTLYYVISQSGDTCKLSLSQGGGAVNVTSDGTCWLSNEPVTS